MPILPEEQFVFPNSLFEGPDDTPSGSRRWWALHTKPRAEKSLARTLLNKETPFFLPVHKHRRRNRGRLFCSFMPLFPGYLFLYGDEHDRFEALQTNRVAHCIPVGAQNELHDDLKQIYQLIVSDAALTPEEKLEPGMLVEITSGPFAGLNGCVVRRGSQMRLVVEVRFIQRGVSVEVENWMIRLLSRRSA